MKFVGFCLSLVLLFNQSAYAVAMVWEASVRDNGVTLKLEPQEANFVRSAPASISGGDLTVVVTELGATKETIYTSFEIKTKMPNQQPYVGYWEISKNSRSEWMGTVNGALVVLKVKLARNVTNESSGML